VIVRPDSAAPFAAEDNVVAGNVLGYGATAGELYVRGVAGERFCVRNSGLTAVVEGVGDHACEYMTGGRVVILGRHGRNVAAGMSGGIAYVLDLDPAAVNPAMVDLEPVSAKDVEELRAMVATHAAETGSTVAAALLADWPAAVRRFCTIVPRDYKRVLEATRRAEATGRPIDEAIMEAARG
jgi:glutamate synthase (NADPH) large chain